MLNDEKSCRKLDTDKILRKLRENYLIGAAAITGGEPLMQEEIIELLEKIKYETNLLVKIDTNGFYPERLEKALEYLDFLTIDVKAPLDKRYGTITGLNENWQQVVENVKKSLEILEKWDNLKEARTTIVPGLIDKKEEIIEIAREVDKTGFDYYTLQQFRPENTLDPEYEKKNSPSHQKMKELGRTAAKKLPNTRVRIVTLEHGFEEIK